MGMHQFISVAYNASQVHLSQGHMKPFGGPECDRLGYAFLTPDVDYQSNTLVSQSLNLFSCDDLVLTPPLTFIPMEMSSHHQKLQPLPRNSILSSPSVIPPPIFPAHSLQSSNCNNPSTHQFGQSKGPYLLFIVFQCLQVFPIWLKISRIQIHYFLPHISNSLAVF